MFYLFLVSVNFLIVQKAYAQESASTLKGIIDYLIQLLGGVLIPISVAILILMFIYNIFLYLKAINDGDTDADKHQKRLLYPVIIIFLVFTLYAFIELFRIFFGAV